MKETLRSLRAGLELLRPSGHRLAVVEQTRYCNRRCAFCAVPVDYDPASELTLHETKRVIDALHRFGFRAISYMGGEALADHFTKEHISISKHTIEAIRYASSKGMVSNVSSNGDFLTEAKIRQLAKAGLSFLTLGLHSYTKRALQHLIEKQEYAAKLGIVPTITTVFTSERTDLIPGIARYVTRRGILFGIGIVQDRGGSFSSRMPELVPTVEQQHYVFDALIQLKRYGLIRTNTNYLRQAPTYYPNNWKCDPRRDTFIHVGAGGTLNLCSEVRTNLSVASIASLGDTEWRRVKHVLVRRCSGCLHQCYFELENPAPASDVSTAVVIAAIMAGRAGFIHRWGEIAAQKVTKAASTRWALGLGETDGLTATG